MLCVYPKGHGKGGIVYKRSADGGKTWSERLPTPASWATSREVPTIHRVVDAAGKKRLVLWSGLYPARLSVSEDDGANWSELKQVGDWGGIVVMGCQFERKTGAGHYMAMFHDDGRFFKGAGKTAKPPVFTLYSTTSTDGGLSWSDPKAIYQSSKVHLCEPGVVRSPDGKQLAVLLRENARRKNSHIIFSDDEGETWTEPREMPDSLNGDRHTAQYLPDGRLFISFRSRGPKEKREQTTFSGDWVAWVGTYEDLLAGRPGQYHLRLKDNKNAWDCAYPGVERLPDGTIVTTTYGHWDEGESPYILSVCLTAEELDELGRAAAAEKEAAAVIDQAIGQDAIGFWDSYDPRAEDLALESVQSWQDEHGRYQLLRYRLGDLSGSNRSASPVIAAYYGVPKTASAEAKVPGIVHIHGGGQRAHKGRVADWVKLGYACISVNWGGRVLEQPDTPNTDWDGLACGFERPGATGKDQQIHWNLVKGGPHTLHKEMHLLNSSWNLIAMSCRRALTVLEQQPEVDADRLGMEGHSMGGRSTVLSAIDPRVKAASPSVGGSGYLYQDLWGLPNSARRMRPEDGLHIYGRTVSAQAYWPRLTAPTLFLQASNDFNAPTELVLKAMGQRDSRMLAIAPHFNHRFTAETSAARFMWMETHLKGTFDFPKLSASRLVLDTADGVPELRVRIDRSAGLPVENVDIFYGTARDPRIRFLRRAKVEEVTPDIVRGACPVFDTKEPLFAFANITYKMPRPLPARPGKAETDLLTVSSAYQFILPAQLQAAKVKAQPVRERLIDDFSRGFEDWYQLNATNPHHWYYGTRKLVDPTWMGPKGGKLAITLETDAPDNHLAIGIEVNAWQSYTGRKKDVFHAIVSLPEAGSRQVVLAPGDFKNGQGGVLVDWDEATELSFMPARRLRDARASKTEWNGSPLVLKELRWQGGDMAPRPFPHEIRASKSGGARGFGSEFQQAIDDSVELEKKDEGKP